MTSLVFDKPGIAKASYGYTFGVHYWKVKIEYNVKYNYNKDANGLMMLGILSGWK